MWVRRSAIKPIPRHARVSQSTVAVVEAKLASADARAQRVVADAYQRFSNEQQALAEYLRQRLPHSLDDVARSLGQTLSVALFMTFEQTSTGELRPASADDVAAADAALAADEELRRTDPVDALDSEDIIAIEQPALVAFVNHHIGITLEKHADSADVDDVAHVFRALLVEIMALSHAVIPPDGAAREPEPI